MSCIYCPRGQTPGTVYPGLHIQDYDNVFEFSSTKATHLCPLLDDPGLPLGLLVASDQVLHTVHIEPTVLTLQQHHLQTHHILLVSEERLTGSLTAASRDRPSRWLGLGPPPAL